MFGPFVSIILGLLVYGKFVELFQAAKFALNRPLQNRERTGKEHDCFPFV